MVVARIAGAAVLVACTSAAAAGQDTPPADAARPPIVPTVEQKRLDLNLSLFEAYDLTTLTDAQPGLQADPRLRQDLSFSGISGSLSFTRQGHRGSFGALAGTDMRYYSIAPTVLPVDYFGGLNFSATLSRHVSVHGAGSASYSPYYSFGTFLVVQQDPNQLTAPRTDQNVTRLETYTSNASGGLTWSPTRYTSLEGAYAIGYVTTPELVYRLRTQTAGATFRHRTSRYSELRLGYARRESETGLRNTPLFVADDIDVGIGYHRPLSFSRRTVVGFDVGSTIVSQQSARSFFVTGDASLSYQLKRTWAAGLYYRRDVGTIGGIAMPFVSDLVAGVLGGSLARELAFDLSGGYSRGMSAVAVTNGYAAVTGSARLRYTLSKYIPVYGEYVYYRYRFDRSIGLAPGFPLFVNRQGLRGGLAYSIPLVGRRLPRS